jgi:hypothetical protein
VTQNPAQIAALSATPEGQTGVRLAEVERLVRVALQQLGWAAGRAYRVNTYTPATGYARIPVETASYGAAQFSGGNYVTSLAGYYLVLAELSILLSNASDDATGGIAIGKNGNIVSYGTDTMAPPGVINVVARLFANDIVQCAQGDTLELWGYAIGSDANFGVWLDVGAESGSNYLAVARVG